MTIQATDPKVLCISTGEFQTFGITNLCQSSVEFETWIETDHLPDLSGFSDIIIFLSGFTKQQVNNFFILLNDAKAIKKTIACYNSNDTLECYLAFKHGVQRFINSSSSISELKIDIDHCIGHKSMRTYYPKGFIDRIIATKQKNLEGVLVAELKSIEKEIISLLWKGETNDEIADRLSLSVRSIERYRSRLLKKTRSDNILGLMRKMLEEGVLTV
ncbi:response regulator transcription factor [Salibacter halophilus]|uniref:Helix-turn-helix transcriptional regulator n=1 Tax=Salibacter halophilus TaxID=1803916 RepID=A0A6N6M6S0_9FLAO|nr:helix-turn-helix transcriptional regulator [Salibacter halophilus]KAB1061973.1 helix-turn-helix transcriptional regulator [Salibacter halophilus]